MRKPEFKGKHLDEKLEGELTRELDAKLAQCKCMAFSIGAQARQKNGMPDRLYAHPVLRGGASFVEWKRLDRPVEPHQVRQIRRYNDAGISAIVCRFHNCYPGAHLLKIDPRMGSLIRFEAWGGRNLHNLNMFALKLLPPGEQAWHFLRALRIAQERLFQFGLLNDLNLFMHSFDDPELREIIAQSGDTERENLESRLVRDEEALEEDG